MKIKTTKVSAVLMSLSLILLAGCAGRRHATLQTNENGIVHDDSSSSFFRPSISPLELAESYRIKKQADAYDKMMAGLQGGKVVTAANGKFLIALINNDSTRGMYIYHPEIPGMKLTVEPRGGFRFLEVRDIPYEITLYYTNGGLIKKINPKYEADYQEKVSHKKLVGNILVDLVIEVNQIY